MPVSTTETPLGVLLVRKGYLTQAQLEEALAQQHRSSSHKLLGEVVVELELCSEEQVLECLAHGFGVPFAKLEPRLHDPQTVTPIPDDSLFEVDFTGCHCVLIHRNVLETMDPPWFNGHPGREDKYFYLKAQGLGWKTYIDLSTLVGHVLDARIIGAYDFLAHLLYENMLEEYHYDRDRSKDP